MPGTWYLVYFYKERLKLFEAKRTPLIPLEGDLPLLTCRVVSTVVLSIRYHTQLQLTAAVLPINIDIIRSYGSMFSPEMYSSWLASTFSCSS